MGKRSTFPRRKNDDYPTPYEAVLPLLKQEPGIWTNVFYEPCVGQGFLANHLVSAGWVCAGQSDLECDARTTEYVGQFDMFVTNPPWSRELLHPIILNLSRQKRTWLLFDADWMHTKQAVPYLHHCVKIVSVGRVKWIPDSPYTGKDNCCWYLFTHNESTYRLPTEFIGR